jgi:hypothetical protein
MTDQEETIEQQEDSDAPYGPEEVMEKFILLEDELEGESVEPEEEPEDIASRAKREEIEMRFARYERNYRSRRIRELTLTPFKKNGRRGRPRKITL